MQVVLVAGGEVRIAPSLRAELPPPSTFCVCAILIILLLSLINSPQLASARWVQRNQILCSEFGGNQNKIMHKMWRIFHPLNILLYLSFTALMEEVDTE